MVKGKVELTDWIGVVINVVGTDELKNKVENDELKGKIVEFRGDVVVGIDELPIVDVVGKLDNDVLLTL